ncbi:MAG TPA: exodeoxyribonuclease VII large subunit [Burkholderiaceae bacterium]|nr:exodeoxyribonuclease VII large subunit [Burkholderiaceae bacterium]
MQGVEPFDPRGGPGRMVWDVAGLLRALADALAVRFGAVAVQGEVSGFSRAASGHCYFNLKDPSGAAAVRCVMFRRAAALLDFMPSDGMQVELRGRLAVYEARGDLQLMVEGMRRAGAGLLMEQFLRLKARLEAEGLFDSSRKRVLPAMPRCLGVITSLTTAALQDVATALARRAPHVRVVIYPAAVQGAEAPTQLARAIELAGARAEADVLIVCRGGGSLEDLWAFNDERVVRAVAASRLPVICGVGHESDVTLSDFAADLRAPTPTAAAELAAPSARDAEALLAAWGHRLARALGQRLDTQAQRLDRVAMRLARPADALRSHGKAWALLDQRRRALLQQALARQRQRQQEQARRLQRGSASLLRLRRAQLEALGARLQALDPLRVVARGYALIQTAEGALVVEPGQLHDGQDLRLTLAGGQASLRAERVLRK